MPSNSNKTAAIEEASMLISSAAAIMYKLTITYTPSWSPNAAVPSCSHYKMMLIGSSILRLVENALAWMF